MPGGYGIDPRMVVGDDGGLLTQLAQRMTMGTAPPGSSAPQMPNYQGAATQQAYRMAGPPPVLPAHAAPAGIGLMPSPDAILAGGGGGGSSATPPNNKFSGAAGGALSGFQVGGPWGALAGGILGYGASGGAKDMNPIDASGFSGITMDKAWEDQNLARLGSNPAAAVGSKLGVSSNSVLGKILDPGSLFGNKHGDEKRNLSAFTKENPLTDVGNGILALPNGAQFPASQLKDIAGTWYGATYHPDGDQQGWQQRYDALLSQIYSQPQPNLHLGG